MVALKEEEIGYYHPFDGHRPSPLQWEKVTLTKWSGSS